MQCQYLLGYLVCGPIAGADQPPPTVAPVPLVQSAQSVIDAITGQIQRCWAIPATASPEDLAKPISFTVQLDAAGKVLLIKRLDSGTETAMVKSAEQAISRCSPYTVPYAGTFTIKFDASDIY